MCIKVMETFDAILSRRSVRWYDSKQVETELLNKLIQGAIWAPSGNNCQPWKFKIVTDKRIIESISLLTVKSRWLKKAPHLIFVYLDHTCSYNYLNDVKSCGAAIQNILLTAYDMGIGCCWVGELTGKAYEVNGVLQLGDELELMGAVSLGYGRGNATIGVRKDINDFLI